nr:ComF family protein [uncultured Sphingomonas sp.]
MTRWPIENLKGLAAIIVDFALPPRCAGCGEVVEEQGSFCADCWPKLQWLGNGGCKICGVPLAATEVESCGRCLTEPPVIDRIRAALAYDDMARGVVLKLKYGRKVGLARVMARYMAPLRGNWDAEPLIVPVPLHRWRLWNRGFNQSSEVARALAKHWGVSVSHDSLTRTRQTRPLKGMNPRQRRDMVRGAFTAGPKVKGRHIVLIDDVMTSGSTAEACARTLRKAGAVRVELICWARVVRTGPMMR